jgi:hypothetical protein
MEPGGLAWRRMQARKFIWLDGEVIIEKLPNKEGKTRSEYRDRPYGHDRPEPGHG